MGEKKNPTYSQLMGESGSMVQRTTKQTSDYIGGARKLSVSIRKENGGERKNRLNPKKGRDENSADSLPL